MAGYGNYGGRRGGGGGRGGSYGGGQGGNRGGGGRRQEYDNRNTVTLWKKDERDVKSDQHPDLSGKFVDADGKAFWVSGWTQRGVRPGDREVAFRIKIGDPCDDDNRGRGRRDDYNRNRRDDDDDRSDRGGRRDSRDDRDYRGDGERGRERYDNRREREEDERRERDDDDRRRSNESQRPFDEGRAGGRGGEPRGRRDDRDDDGYRDRPGPNDRNDGPPPEGPSTYDKDLDDPIPF